MLASGHLSPARQRSFVSGGLGILLFLSFFRCETAAEPAPPVGWHVQGRSGGTDVGSGAAADDAGNVYFASWHEQETTLAERGVAAGSLVISKFDESGKLLWLNQFTNENNGASETFTRLMVDSGTNLVAAISSPTGAYRFGGVISTGITFIKFDRDGGVVWADGRGTGRGAAPVSALDQEGNYLFLAPIKGSFRFGSFQVNGGDEDLLALKVTPEGELRWAKRGVVSGTSRAKAICADAQGNVYIGGFFQGSIGFGPVLTNSRAGFTDGFVVKFDPNGQPLWIQDFRGDGNVQLAGLAVLNDGTVSLCGSFDNSISLGTQKVPGSSAFLGRMDPTGSFRTIYRIGDRFVPSELVLGSDGELVLGGTFTGTTALGGTTVTSRGGKDYVLAKMSSTGVIRWAKPFGYVGDETYDVQTALSPLGDVYVALTDRDGLIVDDLFLEGLGGYDAVLLKLGRPAVPLPVIIESPAERSVLVGASATFSVQATNAARYQWYFNNVAIPSATNGTYTVTNATIANTGDYSVAASNGAGTTRSAPAALVVSGEVTLLVTTLAGTDTPGYVDSTNRTAVRLNQPNGLAYWTAGAIAVADSGNQVIRLMDLDGATITYAGLGGAPGYFNGPATLSQFRFPLGLTVDGTRDIFLADTQNNVIRRVSSGGLRNVGTAAGRPLRGYRDGRAPVAQFSSPSDLVVDANGNIFVTEFTNHTIRKITPEGLVVTVAGNGVPGFVDGTGTNAQFNMPAGIAIDPEQNLYVTEWKNHTIRKVTPQGAVTTLVGKNGAGFADGPAEIARLNMPDGITIDPSRNLYVVEQGNHAIRKIDPDGSVLTVAGFGTPGFKDGGRTEATFNSPSGIMWHRNGSLYVSDTLNHAIRRINLLGAASETGASLSLTVKPTLTITGEPGSTYQIEATEEGLTGAAAQWTAIATVKLAGEAESWSDPRPPARKKRIYRAVKVP